ncbi:sorbosone dehydrogenase, partial [Caulobacter sp. B11]
MLLMLVGCGAGPSLPPEQGFGANPTLPEPRKGFLPVVKIAPAVRWAPAKPPRPRLASPPSQPWPPASTIPAGSMCVPNGDVLVAETNAPPKPEDSKGLKGWFEK